MHPIPSPAVQLTCTQEDVHIAETVLKATFTTPFPGDFRFERECRWSIRLKITPAKSCNEPTEALAGNAKVLGHSLELDNELQEIIHQTNRKSDHFSELRRHVEYKMSDRLSLKKRKVSGPRTNSQTLYPKRPRYENADDSEDEPWNYIHDAASTAPKTHRDSPCLAIPPFVAADSNIPATSILGVVTDPNVLQQQQIMRNYEEFAGRKSRKDSPMSEGECKVFESIFLNGDEVWSPATEGSGMDFESAMGEA